MGLACFLGGSILDKNGVVYAYCWESAVLILWIYEQLCCLDDLKKSEEWPRESA